MGYQDFICIKYVIRRKEKLLGKLRYRNLMKNLPQKATDEANDNSVLKGHRICMYALIFSFHGDQIQF